VFVLLVAACGSSGPAAPTRTTPTPPVLAPWTPPVTYFPPLSGPSRTFIFDRELSYPVTDYTKRSHFVLYDNGAFELKYSLSVYGSASYRGAYQDTDGVIGLLFGSLAGEPRLGTPGDDATGTLQGNSLTVQYTDYNSESGFEDAVYVLAP